MVIMICPVANRLQIQINNSGCSRLCIAQYNRGQELQPPKCPDQIQISKPQETCKGRRNLAAAEESDSILLLAVPFRLG